MFGRVTAIDFWSGEQLLKCDVITGTSGSTHHSVN